MQTKIQQNDNNEWYEDSSSAEESQEYTLKEYDITAAPNDFNIKTINDFIESGVVKIPAFQRNYVWDIKRASKLIESIIMGIPIPQIFLYEDARNSFLVIDGQQRLMSIYYFIKQRFPVKEKRIELRSIFDKESTIPEDILHNDLYFTKFNLFLPNSLPSQLNKLHGLNYSTLDEYKTTFDLRTIRNVIVKQNLPADDDSAVYEIFNRLNSGGVNLTPQEIRASLYHSSFYTMLIRINSDLRWRELLGLPTADLNMKDLEFLLRGFALLVAGNEYKPSMARFLNNFSKYCKTYDQNRIDYLESLFDSFLASCASLTDKSFRGRTSSRFNISIFDAVFAASCSEAFQNKNTSVSLINSDNMEKLKQDALFFDATQFDTAGRSNVTTRISRAKEILL